MCANCTRGAPFAEIRTISSLMRTTGEPPSTSVMFGALALRPTGAGVSTYIRELLAHIGQGARDAALTALVQRDATADLPTQIQPAPRPVVAGVRRALIGFTPSRRVQLFHGLDVDIPVAGPRASVSTVHDLSVFDVPWATGRFRAVGERALLNHAIRRADMLIAVSEFTAQRISERFHRQATVVPLAAPSWCKIPSPEAVADVRAHYGLPEQFILQLASVEPRKDVGLAIETAKELGIPLVLAGSGSDRAELPHGVLGLGFIPAAHVPALYRAASLVIYVSRYEGFGLPPLEAMACGGAVAASAVGAIPETCRGGAILVERHDVATWARSVRDVVLDSDSRRALSAAAPDVAARLSWHRTAEMTADVYRRAGVDIRFVSPDPPQIG